MRLTGRTPGHPTAASPTAPPYSKGRLPASSPGPLPGPAPRSSRGALDLERPPQPRFAHIPAAPGRAVGAQAVRRVPAAAPDQAWPLGSAPAPSPGPAPRPGGPQPLRGRRSSPFAPGFPGEKGQKGHFRGFPAPFPETAAGRGPGLVLLFCPGVRLPDLRSVMGERAGPARARRTRCRFAWHRPARRAAAPAPEPQRRSRPPSSFLLPPSALPPAPPSAPVPRPARRSGSPPRAGCTHRDVPAPGLAPVSPGRVPGGGDAEARP